MATPVQMTTLVPEPRAEPHSNTAGLPMVHRPVVRLQTIIFGLQAKRVSESCSAKFESINGATATKESKKSEISK